jgi:hypothetical protein
MKSFIISAQHARYTRVFRRGMSRTTNACRTLVHDLNLAQHAREVAMQVGISIMLAAVAPVNAAGRVADLRQGSVATEPGGMLYAGEFDEQKELHQMASDDVVQRGKELRSALQQTYQKLLNTGKLGGGLHGTDVTRTLLPYIPIGTPFSEAEAVLRNAGFVVGPHPDPSPPPNPNKPKDWYAVIAKISPFSQVFPSRADLYVSLLPKIPGYYTVISKMHAEFFVSLP